MPRRILPSLFFFALIVVQPISLFANASVVPEQIAENFLYAGAKQPSVLVLYDGPEKKDNPALLDALYMVNLLGHFTTRREVHPVESYRPNEWRTYDAVFCIIYQKHYTVPAVFLNDVPNITRPFCWLGQQVGQLDRVGMLRRHGLRFEKFVIDSTYSSVMYKEKKLDKGDPDINLLRVIDPSAVRVIATAISKKDQAPVPYIVNSGSFWAVVDSPFSYASENDRYLAFADVLHDILGISHSENHRAIARIEDINALSEPDDLDRVLGVFKKHDIPFAFGYVPVYVNPSERLFMQLGERPEVVKALQKFQRNGGTAVLHGYTHQHRGVTTDDYEFWDDIADRPVRGDSVAFATRRLEEALKDSQELDITPVTWETPHYAGSAIDYSVIRKYFGTTYERRQVLDKLGTDQYFPYPVIDRLGQLVIPENMGYIPKSEPNTATLLGNAEAATVVRDGFASFFIHPFLTPKLLDQLITGIQAKGYRFIDIKTFPNSVTYEGHTVTNVSGPIQIHGRGRFLVERVLGVNGRIKKENVRDYPLDAVIHRDVELSAGETYVAYRQDFRPANTVEKLIRLAKGDVSVFQKAVGHLFGGRNLGEPFSAVILWDDAAIGSAQRDQNGFYETFMALGFDVEKVSMNQLTEDQLGPYTVLVIPQAMAKKLDAQKVDRLLKEVDEGITIITDGESLLSQGLGITLGDQFSIKDITCTAYPYQEIHWEDAPSVPWILRHDQGDDVQVYYADRETNRALVVGGRRGEGRFFYFAPEYSGYSGTGYDRFPEFPAILVADFNMTPLLRRNGADVYFDPGYRQAISIERLAKIWRRSGIRAVHVAGWHFYDKYAYDYERFVRVAHENGILAYAWFEWPHVSQRFWNDHPEWREKNGLLQDAHGGWRLLMDMMNPDCFKAIMKDAQKLLRSADWDGVNVAELTFESSQGPARPDLMTPFNDTARKSFFKKAGFDPIELLKPSSPHFWKTSAADLKSFYDFRRAVNLDFVERTIQMIRSVDERSPKKLEVIFTVLDSIGHPDLHDYLGTDMHRIIDVLNRTNGVLQVEDPEVDWSKAPERYLELGARYKKLSLKNPFMIDINVIPVHNQKQKGYATAQPTGAELIQLWRSAASQAERVCLYAENSIYEQDWALMPYAMAAPARVTKEADAWLINTPFTVVLDMHGTKRRITLDDRPIPSADRGEIIIPSGEHRLKIGKTQHAVLDRGALETDLMSITGELLGYEEKPRGLQIEYKSTTRCALMFNKLPQKIYLDGEYVDLPVLKGDDGYVIMAPAGQHRLKLITESVFSYVIDFTSWMAASLFALFGMVSSGLLAFLFIVITIRRRLRLWRRHVPSFNKRTIPS